MDAWPPSLIATHSGLRGRPGIDLTDDVVRLAVGRFSAFLDRLGQAASVGIALDERSESTALAAVATEAALACGLDVVDFGEVSTPTAKLAARQRGLGGAIVVTGSHLEPEWNGLKLVAAPLYAPVDLRSLPEAGGDARHRGRAVTDTNAVEEHVAAICRSVDADLIRQADLAVASSGGVGDIARLVLERLGCLVGGRAPDAVLVLDPDGDRVGLADERGEMLPSELALPLVALARGARVVVRSTDTSTVVDELVGDLGGTVHIVSPGELHLVEALVEVGAELAGEGNGGIVVPAVGLARDGLAAGVAVVELMARTGRRLSELAASLPQRWVRRSSVPCGSLEDAQSALAALAAELGTEPPANPEDGVVVPWPGGAWGLVRRSATEPVLRLTAEARTEAAAEDHHAQLRARFFTETRA